jgi:hypothetical protein
MPGRRVRLLCFVYRSLSDGWLSVRKAVFSMLAMKRMSLLAGTLSPAAQNLGHNIAQYKAESEKVRTIYLFSSFSLF